MAARRGQHCYEGLGQTLWARPERGRVSGEGKLALGWVACGSDGRCLVGKAEGAQDRLGYVAAVHERDELAAPPALITLEDVDGERSLQQLRPRQAIPTG